MGEMATLDSTGDTKLRWNHWNAKEVEAARKKFNELRAQHYLAFEAEGFLGNKGRQIDEFDPAMEHIIMVPRMVGG